MPSTAHEISGRTCAMASATRASSSFIRRRIASVGKELICAVRGFSCSVSGIESATFGIVVNATGRTSYRDRPSAEMFLGHSARRDCWRKAWRGNESFFRHARNLSAQRRGQKLARCEHAADEGYLKPFLLHFQFANHSRRGFTQLNSGLVQNLLRDFVSGACGVDHSLAETGDSFVRHRWSINCGGQIIRRGHLKIFARSRDQTGFWAAFIRCLGRPLQRTARDPITTAFVARYRAPTTREYSLPLAINSAAD